MRSVGARNWARSAPSLSCSYRRGASGLGPPASAWRMASRWAAASQRAGPPVRGRTPARRRHRPAATPSGPRPKPPAPRTAPPRTRRPGCAAGRWKNRPPRPVQSQPGRRAPAAGRCRVRDRQIRAGKGGRATARGGAWWRCSIRCRRRCRCRGSRPRLQVLERVSQVIGGHHAPGQGHLGQPRPRGRPWQPPERPAAAPEPPDAVARLRADAHDRRHRDLARGRHPQRREVGGLRLRQRLARRCAGRDRRHHAAHGGVATGNTVDPPLLDDEFPAGPPGLGWRHRQRERHPLPRRGHRRGRLQLQPLGSDHQHQLGATAARGWSLPPAGRGIRGARSAASSAVSAALLWAKAAGRARVIDTSTTSGARWHPPNQRSHRCLARGRTTLTAHPPAGF